METLYHQTNKLVQETQYLFSQLQKKVHNLDPQAAEIDIEGKIQQINSNCERLDILCSKGPISQRQNAKLRIDQIKYDSRHLTAALKSWKNWIIQKQIREADREHLLSRQFKSNDHIDIRIDQNEQYVNSVDNAVNSVDNLINQGSGILENLRSQRITLKGAQKRLIDIGNILGLSNTTMRLIDRRARSDCFILIGGMITTVIVITVVIIYFL